MTLGGSQAVDRQHVDGLCEKQPDEEKVVKGPIKKVAYDESGNLSKAGEGFLRKFGLTAEDAYIQDDYLHAKIFNKGKLTEDLLKENVSEVVMKLQGPYFMRWADFEEKFSRPIRWIVSILDEKQVPVKIVDVESSNVTRGHRFSKQDIEIKRPDEYVSKLKDAHVIVNQDDRKNLIVNLTNKEADALGLEVRLSDDLLDEVTYLCEYPIPCVCDFKERYLDVPQMVTVTVMESHQRYFALYKKDGKLTNKFITITNYIVDEFSNIKAGNERVITARLDDAVFFFNEDTKKPLESFVESLKGVTFQKGMGSVYEKTQRIIALSEVIADKLNVSDIDVKRTALLCKADLTTSLVFEFTELQGFIGADYARHSGENDAVVQGVKEHYFPLGADSELAEGVEGQIVGIADKLDTICAVFANGKKPTGSSDPLGVRRAALGVIKTIIEKELELDLSELIAISVKALPKQPENVEKTIDDVEEFFVQRLIIMLADSYKKDVLEACSENKNPLLSLCDYVKRVELVSGLIKESSFPAILESANRITRILKEDSDSEVTESLFVHDSEKNLYEAVKKIDSSTYENLFEGLKVSNSFIEKFFEDVLVNDKDEKVKNNRIALLSILKKYYLQIADFSKLNM